MTRAVASDRQLPARSEAISLDSLRAEFIQRRFISEASTLVLSTLTDFLHFRKDPIGSNHEPNTRGGEDGAVLPHVA